MSREYIEYAERMKGVGKMSTYEFIDIVQEGRSPSGKTARYRVLNRRSGAVLGVISWYAPWRQYTFNPAPNTVYSTGCLEDIADFILEAKYEAKVGT